MESAHLSNRDARDIIRIMLEPPHLHHATTSVTTSLVLTYLACHASPFHPPTRVSPSLSSRTKTACSSSLSSVISSHLSPSPCKCLPNMYLLSALSPSLALAGKPAHHHLHSSLHLHRPCELRFVRPLTHKPAPRQPLAPSCRRASPSRTSRQFKCVQAARRACFGRGFGICSLANRQGRHPPAACPHPG